MMRARVAVQIAGSGCRNARPGGCWSSELLRESSADPWIVSDASLRAGLLLDLLAPDGRPGSDDFDQQSHRAEAVGERFRFESRARPPCCTPGHVASSTSSATSTGCRGASGSCSERLALLHDIAFTSAFGHTTSTRNTSMAAAQSLRAVDEDMPSLQHRRFTGARRRREPSRTRSRPPRNRSSSISSPPSSRANALDAEHRRSRDLPLVRVEHRGCSSSGFRRHDDGADGATARSDMFVEVFGRKLVIRPAGVLG